AEMPDRARIWVPLGFHGRGVVVGDDFGRDVAGLARRVDAPEVADAVEVLRVLAGADVDAAFVKARRADKVAAGAAAAQFVLRVLRVSVELPDLLAGRRFETVEPAVAARENDLLLAVNHGERRVGPLAVHDVPAGQAALPLRLAGRLIDGDEARGVRRGDVDVTFVHAVGGDDVDRIARHQRRARRHVVREDVEL